MELADKNATDLRGTVPDATVNKTTTSFGHRSGYGKGPPTPWKKAIGAVETSSNTHGCYACGKSTFRGPVAQNLLISEEIKSAALGA